MKRDSLETVVEDLLRKEFRVDTTQWKNLSRHKKKNKYDNSKTQKQNAKKKKNNDKKETPKRYKNIFIQIMI